MWFVDSCLTWMGDQLETLVAVAVDAHFGDAKRPTYQVPHHQEVWGLKVKLSDCFLYVSHSGVNYTGKIAFWGNHKLATPVTLRVLLEVKFFIDNLFQQKKNLLRVVT